MPVLVTDELGYVGMGITARRKADGHEMWELDTGYCECCLMEELGSTGADRQAVKDIRHAGLRDLPRGEAVVHRVPLLKG